MVYRPLTRIVKWMYLIGLNFAVANVVIMVIPNDILDKRKNTKYTNAT